MKKTILCGALLCAASLLMAAEFWLEPKKFRYEAGEEMVVDFREGDSFTGELWDMKKNTAVKMQWYSMASMRDLLKTVKPTHGKNLSLKFPVAGTQALVLESQPTLKKWSPKEFRQYSEELELEGMVKTEAGVDSVGEYVVRLAKVLVQVGAKTDDTFKKKTALRLEIIPAKNPYALVTGDYLSCQVLFEGKPLAHALVKVWSRLNRTTFLQNLYTEKDGTVVFPLSTRGAWMVSVVKRVPSGKAGAEWQSLWGSLVFGIYAQN